MKLSSCRARTGRVVVGCRCALTCTHSECSAVQSNIGNTAAHPTDILLFVIFPLIFFLFPLVPVYLFASCPRFSLSCPPWLASGVYVRRSVSLACLGTRRLPYWGLACDWDGEGDLGVRRDSGDKDLQGFLSGFLYLERWRRSGRAGLRREGAAS